MSTALERDAQFRKTVIAPMIENIEKKRLHLSQEPKIDTTERTFLRCWHFLSMILIIASQEMLRAIEELAWSRNYLELENSNL